MNFAIDPTYLPAAIGFSVVLVVILVGAFLGRDGSPLGNNVDKRLRRGKSAPVASSLQRGTGKVSAKQMAASLRRSTRYSENETIDSILRRVLPNPDKIKLRLERTGKAIGIIEFLLIILFSILTIALLLRMLAGFQPIIAGLAGILLGVMLPSKIITIMGNRRVAKFMKEFPAAIDMVVRGLRSGLPFMESVNAVGRDFPDPVGIEFRRITDAVRLGQSMDLAMWDVASRIDVPEFKFMIVAISIQRETGGNLAETLGNLSALLRRRHDLKLKIRALSSEARASAYIIGSLPFVMFGLINFANHEYASMLWMDPRGQIMAGCALTTIFVGFFVMWKMVNFEI